MNNSNTYETLPNLVLLHGWGTDHTIWGEFKAMLTNSFSVKCMNLPGYSSETNITENDIAGLIADSIPDNSLIVAWSLSGIYAIRLAKKHPEKVRALVLLSSTPKFAQDEDWPGANPCLLESFQTGVQNNFSKTLRRFYSLQFPVISSNYKQQTQTLINYYQETLKDKRDTLLSGLQTLSESDEREALQSLTIPVSIILAEQDHIIPVETYKHINVPATILPGAGHASFLTHPENCANHILDFYHALR